MDLPTCPACGQSVLDDDVDDCPFCGASLSGSPSPNKAAPAQSAGTATATATAKPKAAAKKEKEAAEPAEDDPFALERSAASQGKVVQLRRKAEPGRRHAVICPMCETVGYTAKKAAGMDVKCANPKCEFPNFKSPSLDDGPQSEDGAEAPADASLKRLLTPVNLGIGGGVLVAVIVAAIFLSGGKKKPPGGGGGGGVLVNPKTPVGPGKKTTKTVVQQKVNPIAKLKQLRTAVSRQMTAGADGCIYPANVIARQRATIAFAVANDKLNLNDQLRLLRNIVKSGRSYLVIPQVQIGWMHLIKAAPADLQSARELAGESLKIVNALPAKLSDAPRARFDAAAHVAALLIALNRTDDARQVIEANSNSSAIARESLTMIEAQALELDDVEAAVLHRRLRTLNSPPAIAVIALLSARGKWKEAWDWAILQTDSRIKADCVAAWMEARVSLLKTAGLAKSDLPGIDDVAAMLSKVRQAALHARLAVRLVKIGADAEAKTLLQWAEKSFTGVQIPAPLKAPEIKTVLATNPLPKKDWLDREELAAAFMELAHAQLVTESDRAGASLSQGMAACRSLAHSRTAIKELNEVPRDAVATAYGVQDAGRKAKLISRYRQRIRSKETGLMAFAQRRLDRQVAFMEQAIQWGQPKAITPIWKEITDSSAASKGVERESWFDTRVPWMLWRQLVIDGNDTLASVIGNQIKARSQISTDARFEFWGQVLEGLKKSDYESVTERFRAGGVPISWRRLFAQRLAARYVNRGEFPKAYQFARCLRRDPMLQMELLALGGMRLVRLVGPEKAKKIADATNFNHAEKTAVYSGIATAIQIPEAKPKAKSGKKNVEGKTN